MAVTMVLVWERMVIVCPGCEIVYAHIGENDQLAPFFCARCNRKLRRGTMRDFKGCPGNPKHNQRIMTFEEGGVTGLHMQKVCPVHGCGQELVVKSIFKPSNPKP